MDVATYRDHHEGGMAFGEGYGKELAGLLAQEALRTHICAVFDCISPRLRKHLVHTLRRDSNWSGSLYAPQCAQRI